MKKKTQPKSDSGLRLKRKTFEIRFYEQLLEKRPDFINVLIYLGDAYTKRGFYQEGLSVDRRLASLRPEDPVVRYNLACSLSLLGKEKESLLALKRAVLLGYDQFNYILKDSDLENVRRLPEFARFFAKLKKLK
jgi:tetratricopeptide (TPR) repeat protein